MSTLLKTGVFAFALALATSAIANDGDLEGRIESINKRDQSFVVQGINFFVQESTDYDDGLRNFSDLEVGEWVEVDFKYRDNRHIATEIERDD